jgi:murein L,D-transpeptidase YcbB/YkuD
MNKVVKAALALSVSLAAMTVVVLQADAAEAAWPTCTGVSVKDFGSWEVEVPTHNGSTNCALSTSSAFVAPTKTLQNALNDCNLHAGLRVDGIYGSNTKAAVLNFQRSKSGLTRDGIYGPQTGHAMSWPSYTFPQIRCFNAV